MGWGFFFGGTVYETVSKTLIHFSKKALALQAVISNGIQVKVGEYKYLGKSFDNMLDPNTD